MAPLRPAGVSRPIGVGSVPAGVGVTGETGGRRSADERAPWRRLGTVLRGRTTSWIRNDTVATDRPVGTKRGSVREKHISVPHLNRNDIIMQPTEATTR
jgi:hypothetical protein